MGSYLRGTGIAREHGMALSRRWPSVSTVLREAVRVRLWTNPRAIIRYEAADGRIVTVHRATAPNVLKALDGAGWVERTDETGTTWERP